MDAFGHDVTIWAGQTIENGVFPMDCGVLAVLFYCEHHSLIGEKLRGAKTYMQCIADISRCLWERKQERITAVPFVIWNGLICVQEGVSVAARKQ